MSTPQFDGTISPVSTKGLQAMNKPARATAAIIVFVVGIAVIVGAVVYFVAFVPETRPQVTTLTQPTTTTAPASAPVAQTPPKTYGELVKVSYPRLASTQPLGVPLNYDEGAHFVLTDPIYVCSRLDLWITRPTADPAEKMLPDAIDEQTHLLRDVVAFVHWAPDERGKWHPQVVAQRDDGTFELVSPTSRVAIPGKQTYLWPRAFSWGQKIVVPTESGISLLTPGDTIEEIHHEFATAPDSKDPPAPPQVTFDTKGIIAWMPWDPDKRGSVGAVRFTEGKFSPLGPDQGWPQRLVHVVPLLDGSVLQIVRDERGKIQPRLELLNRPDIDEKAITALVDQLSDADPERRQQAYNQLTRYGPNVWPLLEKLAADQPPEARIRLQQLLSNKIQPTMGGLTMADGEIVTASRLPDGGVVFFAAGGVSFPRENADPQIVKPAWIGIRPGRPVELLFDKMLKDAAPPAQQVQAFGQEWVLYDPKEGLQQLNYNHTAKLLRDDEKEFSQLYAIDRRGRWLFRKADPQARETLIVDPTFADPAPRLPIWLMSIYQGETGWDAKDWPCIKSGGAWALRERGWEPLDEKKNEKMNTTAPPRPGADDPTKPLLVDADGNRYFDGESILHVVSKSGKHTVWPLPFAARGRAGGTLLRAKDGTLFLFNQPGRILRIKPTPGAASPFKLEGSFTHRIPGDDNIRRIWLDGANRICIAYDDNKLAIVFPEGHIPPHIATMIPANELR
jgi:hypothetical protein